MKLDSGSMTAQVEKITDWYYPKLQPIGKKLIQKMEEQITSYYSAQGYTVEFVDTETLM